MKIFVHVVSLLQCDKKINILLELTQKKKQAFSHSQAGPWQAQVSL